MRPRIPLPASLSERTFTLAEGRSAGLRRGRLAGADLARPMRGIRHPVATPMRLDALARSLQTRLPVEAFFSSVTAALLVGVPLPWHEERSARLHVTVPRDIGRPQIHGVVAHRDVVGEGEVVVWNGIRVSRPERLWMELGGVLGLRDLVAAGDWLIREKGGATNAENLTVFLRRHPGRRGIGLLRRALPLLNGASESPKESALRLELELAGVRGLVPNLWETTTGGHRYRIDLAIPGLKIAIEYQGDYHADPEQYRRDIIRNNRLREDGWDVVELVLDDLRDLDELVARIMRIIRRRAELFAY